MRSLYYDVHAYKSETRNLRGEKIPSPPKRTAKEEYRPSSWRLASQIERAATEARVKAGMAPEIRNLAQAHEMARGPPPARVVKASPPAQSLEMELLVSGAFDGSIRAGGGTPLSPPTPPPPLPNYSPLSSSSAGAVREAAEDLTGGSFVFGGDAALPYGHRGGCK